MSIEGWANYVSTWIGYYGGDTFDVLRPDYAQVDNTPQLMAAAQRYRLDPVSRKLPEPFFPDAEYYDINGSRYTLQPGDMLIKSNPDGMTAPITILTYGPLKALVGVRTGRMGTILNAVSGTPVYSNIYFDFLREGFPGSSINRNLQESLRIPQTRVILFSRVNLTRLRMHLVETDLNYSAIDPTTGQSVPFQRRWMIEEIDRGGNQYVLTLRNL